MSPDHEPDGVAPHNDSLAVAVPEVVGARRTTWLQQMLGIPGAISDRFSRPGRALPPATLGTDELADLVARSPHANAYLSLEPELTTWGDGDGVLTYASYRNSAFAVGGVHGAGLETLPRVLSTFVDDLAAASYRRALFFPISARERSAFAEARIETLMLGSEAFLDRQSWTLSGKSKADLRQMINRGRKRHGLRTVLYSAKRASAELAPLHRSWLGTKQSPHRMRLVVGSPAFSFPEQRRYFVVEDAHQAPVAFVTLCPAAGGELWGVDVMARPQQAVAGAMDVLITDVAERMFDEGVRTVSLGAAPMAERVEVTGHDRWFLRRTFRWMYRSRFANRLFHFESLARYKDKFDPRWEPVYMGGWPKLNAWTLYVGCRMWGLFGPPRLEVMGRRSASSAGRRSIG